MAVTSVFILGAPPDAAITHTLHARAPLNYLRQVGVRRTMRKVLSRLSAREHAPAHVLFGFGHVVHVEDDAARGVHGEEFLRDGALVCFFAPRAPVSDQIILDRSLVFATRSAGTSDFRTEDPDPGDHFTTESGAVVGAVDEMERGGLDEVSGVVEVSEAITAQYRPLERLPEPWARWAGWDAMSGAPAPSPTREDWARLTAQVMRARSVSGDTHASPAPTMVTHRVAGSLEEARGARVRTPGVTLVGYGHYARTQLLPHLSGLELRRVHERDVQRIGPSPDPRITWIASPWLEDDDPNEVVIAAGYHHTHLDAALHALERGKYAILEKPVITTRAQLDTLRDAIVRAEARGDTPRLLTGYHMAHDVATEWLREDLALRGAETPITYRCVVHEIQLPPGHWYRWPASGSRLVSNGCHWIDHFLRLQEHAPVRHCWAMPEGSASGWDAGAVCHLELENGATFTMILGDTGADRLGTRAHIEIARADRTVRIFDGAYLAEDHRRVLRRATLDREAPHARMVRAHVATIRAGAPGEDPGAILATHDAVLRLDEALRRARGV